GTRTEVWLTAVQSGYDFGYENRVNVCAASGLEPVLPQDRGKARVGTQWVHRCVTERGEDPEVAFVQRTFHQLQGPVVVAKLGIANDGSCRADIFLLRSLLPVGHHQAPKSLRIACHHCRVDLLTSI